MYDTLYWAKEKNKEAKTLLENLILTIDFFSHGFTRVCSKAYHTLFIILFIIYTGNFFKLILYQV